MMSNIYKSTVVRLRIVRIGLVALLSVWVSGCATGPSGPQYLSKQEAFGTVYSERPKSILVVPAVNQSTAADAGNYYSATIAKPLTEQGYYVLPITITDQILNQAGISDGAQLLSVPAKRLGELFGADAVLYVTINLWDTNYFVLGGNVTVKLEYRMVSTTTNENLWRYKDQVVVDTSGSGNNGLLGAIIETAINTSTQDYLPVAHQVNSRSIYTMPYGLYHPQHGQDGIVRVVNPGNLVTVDVE